MRLITLLRGPDRSPSTPEPAPTNSDHYNRWLNTLSSSTPDQSSSLCHIDWRVSGVCNQALELPWEQIRACPRAVNNVTPG